MLYSMSKSVTGLAVGIACDEGYLDINERLVEIFPEYVTNSNAKILKAHTLKHNVLRNKVQRGWQRA